MLTKKFDYPTLSKSNGPNGRRYVDPKGTHLPSVTTILSATTSKEKQDRLIAWRKRIGDNNANAILKESSGRGTRMHKFLEDYIKTDVLSPSGTNPYSIQSHKMATSIIQQGLAKCQEFWGTEVSLYFPEIYAGTTDLVGVHDNSEAIMDHKQANKVKKREWIEDYFIQVTAYASAHNEVHGTSIRKGVIFMCTPNLEYQEFILEGNEFQKYSDLWWKKLEEYYSKFV